MDTEKIKEVFNNLGPQLAANKKLIKIGMIVVGVLLIIGSFAVGYFLPEPKKEGEPLTDTKP